MIIVNDIFVAKPGNASKMAKMFKEMMSGNKEFVRVMTDAVGQFNRVIMVSQYEDLAAYQKTMEAMMNPTEEQKRKYAKMEGYTEMYLTGSREIYKVM